MTPQPADLTLLRDLGHDLVPEDTLPPPGLRAHVLTQLAASSSNEATTPRTSRSTPPAPRRRRVLIGTAAAAAVLLALLPSWLPDSRQSSAAARVLQAAAAAAAYQAANPPAPDAFIYVDILTSAVHTPEIHFRGQVIPADAVPASEMRLWLPVDPTRTGLMQNRERSPDSPWRTGPIAGCQPPCQPGDVIGPYRADLPTTAPAMLDYLYGRHPNRGASQANRDWDAFLTVNETVQTSYLPPAVQQALFQAMSQIPSVVLRDHERDLLGRPAVAISVPGPDNPPGPEAGQPWLLFDPNTYTYLGSKTIQNTATSVGPAGYVQSSTAITTAIVAEAGQTP